MYAPKYQLQHCPKNNEISYLRYHSLRYWTQALHMISLLMVILTPVTGIASDTSRVEQNRCTDGPFPISVFVQGLRNNQGTIKAKLYGDNPDEFLVSGKKLYARRIPALPQSLPLCLYAPNPGSFAVVIHHDENGNKKLDQNWIGMPIEGVGFSNNPELFLAPPNHEDVIFHVHADSTIIDIQLKY